MQIIKHSILAISLVFFVSMGISAITSASDYNQSFSGSSGTGRVVNGEGAVKTTDGVAPTPTPSAPKEQMYMAEPSANGYELDQAIAERLKLYRAADEISRLGQISTQGFGDNIADWNAVKEQDNKIRRLLNGKAASDLRRGNTSRATQVYRARTGEEGSVIQARSDGQFNIKDANGQIYRVVPKAELVDYFMRAASPEYAP